MVELAWRAGLYRRLIGAPVRAQLQYRLSFAFDLLGTFLINFIDFIAIIIIFSHLPRLAGWSLAEVGFFYGTANMSFALADLLVGHLDGFSALVRSGNFDSYLLRPAGSLFSAIASDLALRRVGRVAQGAIVLVYALSHLTLVWTPLRAATLVIMLVTGVVIYGAIWVMGTALAFWTTEIREVTNAFTYGGSFLASYPVNIFGGWTRRLLAFVVPMAFVSYFPGLIVLGHPDPLGAPEWVRYCTPLVALSLAFIAGRMWRIGVRQYRSTGS